MYYLCVFILLLLAELGYFFIAKRLGVVDRPNERSSHSKPVLLGGGIIFYLALLFYSLANRFAYPSFLIGLTLLAVVSYVDDLKNIPSIIRLGVQIFAVLFSFWYAVDELEVWQIVLLTLSFVGVMNVYNFMDGVNGMLAGYSLVVLATFGYLNLFVHPFVETGLLVTAAFSVLIFGFFNFRRNARCFSGDVGSIVMGFLLIFLWIRYDAAVADNGENVSLLCFVLVFLVDGGLTVAKRFLTGKNILEAHREHLYETLVNDLHIPHLRVSVAYALLQLVINAGYMLVADKNLYTLLWAVVLVASYGLFFYYCNVKKGIRH